MFLKTGIGALEKNDPMGISFIAGFFPALIISIVLFVVTIFYIRKMKKNKDTT